MAQAAGTSRTSPARIPLYDNAKFVLICCVVIGHLFKFCRLHKRRFARATFVFIYAFHMPLFMFISGLFVDRRRLTRRSACLHAAEFYALGMLAKLIRAIGRCMSGLPFRVNLFVERGFPWYLFALATYYLLAWLLRRCDYRKVGCVALFVSLVAGYLHPIGNFLCLSRIIVFFPFFWAGHALDARRVAERLAEPKVRGICLGVVAAFALLCAFHTKRLFPYRTLFTGRYRYAAMRLPGWGWVHRTLAYLMSFAVGAGVLGLIPQEKLPYITPWGRRTLQVYLLHYEIVVALAKLKAVRRLFKWGHWGWTLLVPLGVAIACLLALPDIKGAFGRIARKRAGSNLSTELDVFRGKDG